MKPQRRTDRDLGYTGPIASIERVDGELPEHLKKFAEPLVAGDLNSRRPTPSRLHEKFYGTKESKLTFKQRLEKIRKQRLQRELESK